MAHSKDMREDEAGETVRGMTMQHLVIHINNVVVVCLFVFYHNIIKYFLSRAGWGDFCHDYFSPSLGSGILVLVLFSGYQRGSQQFPANILHIQEQKKRDI